MWDLIKEFNKKQNKYYELINQVSFADFKV